MKIEIKEKIAKYLCLADFLDWEQLPQTGYPSSKDRDYYFNCVEGILCIIKQENYVRLADDQSLPNYELSLRISEYSDEIQEDMLKAGFRKVEL